MARARASLFPQGAEMGALHFANKPFIFSQAKGLPGEHHQQQKEESIFFYIFFPPPLDPRLSDYVEGAEAWWFSAWVSRA